MAEIKRTIRIRVYILYFGIVLFSALIVGQIFHIQVYEGKYWKKRANEFSISTQVIKATQGSIYADDGKALLATSVPLFELRLNVYSRRIKDEDFMKTVGALADSLSCLFKDRTCNEYLRLMNNGRKNAVTGRYMLIKRDVKYGDLHRIKRFPKFRTGRNAIGLEIKEYDTRVLPYGELGRRTIGFDALVPIKDRRTGELLRTDTTYVGLEGYFTKATNIMRGTDGKGLVRLVAGGERLPLYNDSSIVEPRNGKDIVTTINVDLQEVAESSLMENLSKNRAEHGCAILMEVSTGEIKAIVNLKRDSIKGKTTFTEAFNYAIGEAKEPGSTFKLASLLVALEDKVVDTNSRFNTDFDKKTFGAKVVSDAHVLPGIHTVKEIFEHSSNIGTVTVIWKNYSNNPQKFIDGLYKLDIQKPLGLTILGEKAPDIKDTKSGWWHTDYSLPSMAFGYEVELTPLQILTLYNAIANNGIMVRPMFVKEIRKMGKTERTFGPTVINQCICSKETQGKLRKMMEGVVERGTGKDCFKNALYKVAGKTGTAQINYTDKNKGIKMNYRASFVGYFPADKPKYSCIVVIANPSAGKIFGASVAAPVFKDIADKVYSTFLNNYQSEAGSSKLEAGKSNKSSKSVINYNDLKIITQNLGLGLIQGQSKNASPNGDWVTLTINNEQLEVGSSKLEAGKSKFQLPISSYQLPDVKGMGMKDAIWVRETMNNE